MYQHRISDHRLLDRQNATASTLHYTQKHKTETITSCSSRFHIHYPLSWEVSLNTKCTKLINSKHVRENKQTIQQVITQLNNEHKMLILKNSIVGMTKTLTHELTYFFIEQNCVTFYNFYAQQSTATTQLQLSHSDD